MSDESVGRKSKARWSTCFNLVSRFKQKMTRHRKCQANIKQKNTRHSFEGSPNNEGPKKSAAVDSTNKPTPTGSPIRIPNYKENRTRASSESYSAQNGFLSVRRSIRRISNITVPDSITHIEPGQQLPWPSEGEKFSSIRDLADSLAKQTKSPSIHERSSPDSSRLPNPSNSQLDSELAEAAAMATGAVGQPIIDLYRDKAAYDAVVDRMRKPLPQASRRHRRKPSTQVAPPTESFSKSTLDYPSSPSQPVDDFISDSYGTYVMSSEVY